MVQGKIQPFVIKVIQLIISKLGTIDYLSVLLMHHLYLHLVEWAISC